MWVCQRQRRHLWETLKRVIVSSAVYPRFFEITELPRSLSHSWATCNVVHYSVWMNRTVTWHFSGALEKFLPGAHSDTTNHLHVSVHLGIPGWNLGQPCNTPAKRAFLKWKMGHPHHVRPRWNMGLCGRNLGHPGEAWVSQVRSIWVFIAVTVCH